MDAGALNHAAVEPVDAARRAALTTYFDRTAAEAWKVLTTDSPVSRIRATVRAGRQTMRDLLLSWLPEDLDGATLFDAGCGTGALAVEAARRGADVTGVDVAASLVAEATARLPAQAAGRVRLETGDMHDPAWGVFDHVAGMDSLIHYEADDIVTMLAGFAARTRTSILFTVAPSTPALELMRAAGRLFPRSDRAPAIVPVAIPRLARMLAADPRLAGWHLARSQRVSNGFYTSQALELVRA